MDKSTSKLIDSIISRGSEFKGEFSIIGNVKVDGIFRGRIISDGKVIIGTKGIGICDIIAKEVVIGGEVRGNVIAINKISVLESAHLKGNIMTTSLHMEEGVKFNGYCKINASLFKNDKKMSVNEMAKLTIISSSDSEQINNHNTTNDEPIIENKNNKPAETVFSKK